MLSFDSSVSSPTWRKHGTESDIYLQLKGQNMMHLDAQNLIILVLSATFQTFDKYSANGSRFRTSAASETKHSSCEFTSLQNQSTAVRQDKLQTCAFRCVCLCIAA